MTSVKVRCVIERLADGSTSQPADSTTAELDSVAAVPASLPFHDLPHFILITFGYSSSESLACRVSVEVRNWKPIPLDSVTDDFSATVEQILGSLASFITIRIRLTRMSKFRVVDEVKHKVLAFLLQNAQDLLVSSGCPIKKSELDSLVRDSCSSLSVDTKQTFDRWYSDQMTSSHHDDNADDEAADGREMNSSPATGRLANGHVRGAHGGGRTWFDPVTEIPRLQRWLRDNTYPTRAQMATYARQLNAGAHRQSAQRPLDVNNIAYWFKNARARALLSRPARRSASPPADEDDRVDTDAERLPQLPNSNAVYVVPPARLPSDVTEESGYRKRRRRGSLESDENHNERCASSSSSSGDVTQVGDDADADGVATDLSVRRTRSSSSLSAQSDDRLKTDDRSQLVSSPAVHPALASTTAAPLSLSLHVQQALQQQMQLAMRYMQPLYPSTPAQRWLPWLGPGAKREMPDDDSSTAGSTTGAGGAETLGCAGGELRRKRSRVFIDPLSEIPRLEQWFAIDSHPSSPAIERLTDELNRSAYRQRFPPLEPKNVQLWFKNHRAKVKRQSLESLVVTSQLVGDVGDDVKLPALTTSLPGNHCAAASDVMMTSRDEAVS